MNRSFLLGQIAATPRAIAAAPLSRITACLRQHAAGEWGEVDEHDRQANESALTTMDRLMSVHRLDPTRPCEGSNRLWIVTEGDRSVTTALLPDEY